LKKIVIAISGLPGSGKSTYAKLLANHFNLRFISVGDLFRRLAENQGVDFNNFHQIAEKHI